MIWSDFRPTRPALDDVAPEPREVTEWGSRWSDLRCPRLYRLRWIDRLVSTRPSDALDIGTMYHRAHRAYFGVILREQDRVKTAADRRRVGDQAAVEARACLMRFARAFEEAGSPAGMDLVGEAQRFWQGWLAHYGPDAGFQYGKLLAVEEAIEARLPGPEWRGTPPLGDEAGPMVTARLDTAAALRGRRAWIVEKKTAHARSRDVREGFALDLQLLRQAWLWSVAARSGKLPPLAGIVIDIAYKLKEPEYEQIEHVYDDEDLARFLDTMRFYEFKRQAAAMHGWPHDFTQCKTQYGLCSYYDNCLVHGRSAMGYRRLGEAVS